MKKRMIAKWPASGLCILALGLATTGCVDDSYDMSKDIDMTMGIGADGLQLKVGTTEKIGLGKLLDFENEDLLGTTTDNLFYLTQSGSSDFDINVDPVKVKINEATLTPEINIVNWPIGMTVPAGKVGEGVGTTASDKFDFKVDDIGQDVKNVKHITPAAASSHFTMRLEITGNHRNHVRFESVKNLKITFPYFIKSKAFAADNSYTVPDKDNLSGNVIPLGRVDIDGFELKGDKGQIVENESFNVSDDVSMTGDFELAADRAFSVNAGDELNVRLIITLSGNEVDRDGNVMVNLDKVTGCFDPEIKPEVDPVKIADELPDFLTDDAVTMDVSDVTLKFNVDMREIPATLEIKGVLISEDKDNQPIEDEYDHEIAPVTLPASGAAELTKEKENILYFYKSQAFDVDANGKEDLAANGSHYDKVDLTSLITKLPDHIQIDLGGDNIAQSRGDIEQDRGEVKIKQDELFTIRLGHRYNAHLDYNILMPFKFGGRLNIVYNDTIEDMNEDLQDYEASALVVTAKVVNTIPLNLKATLDAADINGNRIPEIKITPTKAYVTRATEYDESEGNNVPVESELQFDITLDNPKDLKKLDKFFFRIEAEAKENENEEDADKPALMSDQYIIVKDMRLKLKGQIVGDFN